MLSASVPMVYTSMLACVSSDFSCSPEALLKRSNCLIHFVQSTGVVKLKGFGGVT